MKILEQIVVMMNYRSSTATCVDAVRLEMFVRKQTAYEATPPS